MKIIDRGTLCALLADRKPIAVLEALPERYYREWHLPTAQLFPHTEVRERAALLLPDKQQPIVVYCANEACRNSHVAAALLASLGYEDVAVYGAGKADWQAAGLPIEC